MNSMKKLTATLFAFFAFVAIAGATCTVTTDCDVRTYEENQISASVANGVVTVLSGDTVIDAFSCQTNSVSVTCSDGEGEGDFDFDFDFDFGFGFGGFGGFGGWGGWF